MGIIYCVKYDFYLGFGKENRKYFFNLKDAELFKLEKERKDKENMEKGNTLASQCKFFWAFLHNPNIEVIETT